MLVKEVMSRWPVVCRPEDKIDYVARLMVENDCGQIPVCDDARLLGVITDRDITTRVVAAGKTPAAIAAADAMTHGPFTISENAALGAALDAMENRLVRRLPVVDVNDRLVGIISQADLMARVPTPQVSRTLRSLARKTRKPMENADR